MNEFEKRIREESEMEASKKVAFSPHTLSAVYGMTFPVQQWAVDKLVPMHGITILSGAPGHFKSWLFMDMARCIADGVSLVDTFPVTQGKVLLIDEENLLGQAKLRFEKLQCKNPDDIFISSLEGINVSRSEDIEKIISFCEAHNISTVFFDSLVRIHNAEENDAGKMSRVFREIKKLCKAEITVIISHHNRKSGNNFSANSQESARGSSEISAVADSQLSITKNKDKKSAVISNPKARYCEPFESFEVEVASSDETFSFVYRGKHFGSESAKDSARNAILEILSEEEDGLIRTEIGVAVKAKTSIGEKSSRAALKALEEEGLVTCSNAGGNTDKCVLSEQ